MLIHTAGLGAEGESRDRGNQYANVAHCGSCCGIAEVADRCSACLRPGRGGSSATALPVPRLRPIIRGRKIAVLASRIGGARATAKPATFDRILDRKVDLNSRAGRAAAERPHAGLRVARQQAARPSTKREYRYKRSNTVSVGCNPAIPARAARPAYPGDSYGRQGYGGGQTYGGSQPSNGSQRPAYTGQGASPQGHLEDWLSRHRRAPAQDQERMLRSDPRFKRQPPAEQQREIQQLHQVNQMPKRSATGVWRRTKCWNACRPNSA